MNRFMLTWPGVPSRRARNAAAGGVPAAGAQAWRDHPPIRPTNSLPAVLAVTLLLICSLAISALSSGPTARPVASPSARSAFLEVTPHLDGTHRVLCAAPRSCAPDSARPGGIAPPTLSAQLGSSPTNRLVANWSGEGSLAENPRDVDNLVAAGFYQEPAATGNTTEFQTNGSVGVFASVDGGRNWTAQALPPNSTWFQAASNYCGLLPMYNSVVAWAPDGTVYQVDLANNVGSSTVCTSSTPYVNALYISSSADDGVEWSVPSPIVAAPSNYFADKPWIAISASNELFVAYTYYSGVPEGATIEVRNSTDGGATWSAPLVVSGAAEYAIGPQLVVDPAGGLDVAWFDPFSDEVRFARSVDEGATLSTPTSIGTLTANYSSSSPDGFRGDVFPTLGVDDFRGNAYFGDLFLTAQDGSGGSAGNPRVVLMRSSDNGTSWSSPVQVNSNATYEDFEPSIAVGLDGTLYAAWYAEDPTTGHYRFVGTESHDGGRSFDPQVNLSDNDSVPDHSPVGEYDWIGDYPQVIADPTGAHGLWTDARSPLAHSCTPGTCAWGSYVYNISLYSAVLVNDSVASTAPVVVMVGGTVPDPGAAALTSVPSPEDWLVGGQFNLTAPWTRAANATLPSANFDYWFSDSTNGAHRFSRSASLAGTVEEGESFVACYTPAPSSACPRVDGPGVLEVQVAPTNAQLVVSGINVPLVNGSGWIAEPDGTYWVNLSAPGYDAADSEYSVAWGKVTQVESDLLVDHGWLAGSVYPAAAQLAVNGVTALVEPDGSFNVSVPSGVARVSATSSGYAPFSSSNISIVAGRTTVLHIVLTGERGWIVGQLTPSDARLVADGVVWPVNRTGGFAFSLPPGRYWVNATLSGWAPASSGPITLSPGDTATVQLVLWEYTGTVAGTVNPSDASVEISGRAVPVSSGGFAVTLDPGSYALTAQAASFAPRSQVVNVVANETVTLSIALNVSNGWAVGTVDPASAWAEISGVALSLGPNGSFNVTLAPGTYVLAAQAAGYATIARSFVVAPGRAETVNVSLSPSPPQVAPGLLDAAAGVFVAATAAGVFLLVRARRHKPPPPLR